MPIQTVGMRNALATAYGTAAPYVGVLLALTLQSAQAASATSCSVDLSVAVGDTLVFDFGLGTVETRVVTSVTGAGPYTANWTGGLTNARASGALVTHLPIASGTVHEATGGSPAYARKALSWAAAASSAVTATAVDVDLASGTKVGAMGLFSAGTGGNFMDALPLVTQPINTQGKLTLTPTFTET